MPERFPTCKHYPACLDAAARENTSLSCKACLEYTPEPCKTDPYDTACCKALVAAITYPEKYSDQQPQKLVRRFLDTYSRFEEVDSTGSRKSQG